MTADKDDLQSIDGWLNGCMDPLNPLDSTHKLNNQKPEQRSQQEDIFQIIYSYTVSTFCKYKMYRSMIIR